MFSYMGPMGRIRHYVVFGRVRQVTYQLDVKELQCLVGYLGSSECVTGQSLVFMIALFTE